MKRDAFRKALNPSNWLLLPKILCFFIFAGLTCHGFLFVLFQQKGFSDTLIGIINTFILIFGMISTQLCSIIADKFRKHRFVFAILLICTSVVGFFFVLVNNTIILFVLSGIFSVVQTPISTFSDTLVLGILENENRKLRTKQNEGKF